MADKTAAEIAADKAETEHLAAERAEQERLDREGTKAAQVAKVTAAAKKNITNAQKARDKAQAEVEAAELASMDGCETFVVVHPKVNIFVGGDKPEIEISVGTEKVWVDVVDGWAVMPKNTQLRASNGKELADFRMKVSLGFFTAIPAVH